MNILGISFLGDASACLIQDGKLVSAISEERLNRIKLWHGIPSLAISKVLEMAGISLKDIDIIATHGKSDGAPNEHVFKKKENDIQSSSLPDEDKQRQLGFLAARKKHEKEVYSTRTPNYINEIKKLGIPVLTFEHHHCHAASTYYAWDKKECYVLTIDGWGEDGSSSLWKGSAKGLSKISSSATIDSLGYFYGSITAALNFKPHRHEGKVLGLAAYCKEPKSLTTIQEMVSYHAPTKSFTGHMERGMYVPNFTNPNLKTLANTFSREDVASAAQLTLESVICKAIAHIDTKKFDLAVAGGIFANVKLNQRILNTAPVNDLFVFPNMGDGGLSVGAAYLAYHEKTQAFPETFNTALLGYEPSSQEIKDALSDSGLTHEYIENIELKMAEILSEKHAIAVCQGKMEYGPRALGNRSILYHAGDPKVNNWLNKKLNRSEFMPFAPVTLEEFASEYYIDYKAGNLPSRYMTITYDCTEKMIEESPAAVHIDKTARPQIISKTYYPKLHKLLSYYHEITGIPTIINTSFNMHEEPIVCNAKDAITAFKASEIPYLVLGNFLVTQSLD